MVAASQEGLSGGRAERRGVEASVFQTIVSKRLQMWGPARTTKDAGGSKTGVMPNTISPLARTLKLNGYSTAQFGKCHEVPVWQTSPMGPFDAWPAGGGGFEYFYGFIGGETNQYYPARWVSMTVRRQR